jgi:DNA-directed RNA polymerase beta' subunit
MKIVNPLNYPLAVLIAGICLFLGVRIIKLPNVIILPSTVAIALIGSTILAQNNQQESKVKLDNKALEKELNEAKKEAQLLINKAETLRLEAKKLLHDSWQMELLTAVEYSCDRTLELPQKIEDLSNKLSGGDSLLSVEELTEKLKEIKKKQKSAEGLALRQLKQIESSLNRNIALTKQGKSARQAQVFSLTNLITESAGILQQLQNKLRTADLTNSEQIQELKSLSEELNNFQDNVDLLV